MEIIDPIIRFTGKLLGRNQEKIDGVTLKAEFYNLAANRWETILPTLPVKTGSFNKKIDLANDKLRTNKIYQPVYDALATGNMPMTRVSLVGVDADIPAQVVGLGGIVNLQVVKGVNEITINFCTLYYLKPFSIQQRDKKGDPGVEYDLVTFPEPQPIPDNQLFPALQAALNQTERLSEYTLGGHTVFVRPKDDEYEANDAKINELLATIAAKDKELVNEKAKISDLIKALTVEKETVLTLSNELKIEQGKLVEVTKSLEREKAKLDRMTGLYELGVDKILGLEKALILEKGRVLEFTKALEFEKANVVKIAKLLDTEQGNVVVLEKALTAEKENVHTLKADITECKVIVNRLEEEKIDILSRDATPANEIYKSIVNELEIASEESIGGRFSVSNLSLNLKTHIVNDESGFKLQLIDSARADYVQDGTISEVILDIISQEPADATPPILIMPKVNGLTETATRKRLTAFGLFLKPIYQASTTMTIGQAFKQTPEAGEEINVGDTITVIFAKDTENFN